MRLLQGCWKEWLEFWHDETNTDFDRLLGIGLFVIIVLCSLGLVILIIASVWWDNTHTCIMYGPPYMAYLKGVSYMTRDCIEWSK